MNRTYTTQEAAELLGLREGTVRTYILRHGLGAKRGRDWFLTQRDVDFLASRRGKGGRPRKEGKLK